LERRLRGRKTETEESLKKRIGNAEKEIKSA
jgi:guanylate kinase